MSVAASLLVPADDIGKASLPCKKRAPCSYGGWTKLAVAGHVNLLAKHPPIAFASCRYPSKPGGGGKAMENALKRLDKAILNVCWRFDYRAAWCVFIEHGKDAGYHFHIWFAEMPSVEMVDALRRHWLKTTEQPDNSRKVFHFTSEAENGEDMASYLGKTEKAGWRTKRVCDFWGPQGKWKPFRFHRPRGSRRKKVTGSTKKVTGNNSHCFFQAASEGPETRVNPLPVADHSAPIPLSPSRHVQLFHCDKDHGRRETVMYQPAVLAGPPARLVLRIGPRFGRGDVLVPPPLPWIIAQLERLQHGGWQPESIEDAGPCFPPDSLDVTFLIPQGRILEFERVAVPDSHGFARIVRPALCRWPAEALKGRAAGAMN